jgi:hypothetical protein
MSNQTTQARSGGIGFFGLLTLLFVGLKLTHYINWPWKLVLLPMWGPFALALILAVLWFAFVFAIAWNKARQHRKQVKANTVKFHSDVERFK